MKITKTIRKSSFFYILVSIFILIFFESCTKNNKQITISEKKFTTLQNQLIHQLDDKNLTAQTRYAVINQIAGNFIEKKQYQTLILFLTNWVERHPGNPYNSYWLLMTAYIYSENGSSPVAEYYFDRILKNYTDLLVQGKSIHYLCLKELIRISTNPKNKIKYFNELINNFPSEVSTTELYVRLGNEYEKEGDWNNALKAYSMFLNQKDASTIQISGIPDAYEKARHLVDFNNSSKNWTFESLDALEKAVKSAIYRYDWKALDRYRSKVNFFGMSWKQDETDPNSQAPYSMHKFMNGNKIHVAKNLDSDSNPNEAYLKTSGWSTYVSVWYLYFRKVNFPLDPEIHGRWEWAGIYFGEKL